MNLIYLTSKRYPSSTADHFFVRSMSKAFGQIMGSDFSLFISGRIPSELDGINVASVSSPKKLRTVFYLFWIPFFIFRKKKNNKETIFFSNDPYLLIILIFWRNLFGLKYKICSDWHQLWNDWRDKFISRRSNFLISTSSNLKKMIVSVSGVNENKILIAYGGVNLDDFENKTRPLFGWRANLKLSASDFLVGYVGFYRTMGMSKGLDIMISALPLIPDKKVKMVFVGGRNAEIEDYKAQAKALGVLDRTIFVPAKPNNVIPAYEASMDVLVIPYPDKPHFRDYGFPMKVYEYMASKRPIIYSNLPIIAEVLSDCAISFEPGNERDLAQKIEGLVSEPQNGIDLAEKAFKKAENFTWRKRAEKITWFIDQNSRFS